MSQNRERPDLARLTVVEVLNMSLELNEDEAKKEKNKMKKFHLNGPIMKVFTNLLIPEFARASPA